jgi:hypothetical protein
MNILYYGQSVQEDKTIKFLGLQTDKQLVTQNR